MPVDAAVAATPVSHRWGRAGQEGQEICHCSTHIDFCFFASSLFSLEKVL
jgi:hypothetical protein